MDKAPSGITGLETSLGLGIKSLVQEGHISLMKLMELMSTNPAKLYRMIPGSISEDAPADIVIFGENEEWTVKEEEYASKAVNSPFTGWTLPGKVRYIETDLKVPQIGWNSISIKEDPLFKYTKDGDFVYYVHSYCATECEADTIAVSDYHVPITGAVHKGNVWGTQFHPEKSGNVGLGMLRAFNEL